jgi:hypothetical protein
MSVCHITRGLAAWRNGSWPSGSPARADSVRVDEAILRNQRGVELGQSLQEGMDLRGAAGNAATKLPPGPTAPAAWAARG